MMGSVLGRVHDLVVGNPEGIGSDSMLQEELPDEDDLYPREQLHREARASEENLMLYVHHLHEVFYHSSFHYLNAVFDHLIRLLSVCWKMGA